MFLIWQILCFKTVPRKTTKLVDNNIVTVIDNVVNVDNDVDNVFVNIDDEILVENEVDDYHKNVDIDENILFFLLQSSPFCDFRLK